MVDLYAAQFDLQFNPSTLTAVSVTQGRFLGTGGSTVFVPGAIDNTTGRITFTAITLVGPVTGVTGNGTLATITFTAKTTAATSILTLSNVVLLTSALADFAATVQNAFVGPPIPTLSDGGLLLSSLLLCALGLRMMRSPRMAQ